jgi:SLOG in TRPM, prokaryote/SMODS and SLOG-associating 2TM effector domain 1/Protein of unknown function (DUF4231)
VTVAPDEEVGRLTRDGVESVGEAAAPERGQAVREVTFPNGNTASLLVETPHISPSDMVALLDLGRPLGVIVVAGGADTLDPALTSRLHRLFGRGVVQAATAIGAVLVDGGTGAGVMAILGESVAGRDPHPPLVGVAPVGKVTYPGRAAAPGDVPLDENHTHFVLANTAEWGGETDLLMDLVEGIAGGSPVVTIVVGGGDGALEEATQAARRRWPLVVLKGTGGIADTLAGAAEDRKRHPASPVENDGVAEILAEGEIEVFPIDHDPVTLGRLVARRVQQDESVRLAWEQFALLNQGAVRHQKDFRRTQLLTVGVGLLGTALALTQTELEGEVVLASWVDRALRYALLLVPIVLTALVAAAGRFKAASKWVLLRGGAESVKREIFRYRARAGPYSDANSARVPAQVKLAGIVGELAAATMQTEVNLTALAPYEGPLPPADAIHESDDGFSRLSPERYLEVRLLDQLRWYRRKSVSLEVRLRRLRWLIITIGGVGTFLAAVGFELWIALTTAVVAAATTYLEYEQVESTLLHYNQAASGLETVREWWIALPVEAQVRQANVDRLVEHAEKVMQSEQTGWVQEMQDALAELRLRQTQSDSRGAPGPRSDN